MEKIAEGILELDMNPLGYLSQKKNPMICSQISNSDLNQAIQGSRITGPCCIGTTYYCMGSIYNVEELTKATQMHLYHING